jgi:hypothetical protein
LPIRTGVGEATIGAAGEAVPFERAGELGTTGDAVGTGIGGALRGTGVAVAGANPGENPGLDIILIFLLFQLC